MTVDNPDNDAHALIIFTDRAGNQTCAEIDYRAIKITIDPLTVDFGLMKKNKVATKDIIVKNEGTSKVTVTRLEFQKGGQGVFKFVPDLSTVLPFDLEAGATKSVTIQYTSTNDGDIEDSVGVGNDCIFRYRTLVKARTGEPVINVTDIPFGSVVVGTSAKKSFQVSNDGNVKLTVSNQSGVLPAGSPYTSTSDVVTTGSPLVLDLAGSAAGNTKSFDVTFAPTAVGTFNATITFSSDASTVDSVCVITGVGIKPGLSANLVDFGRRRISGNKNYTGPYTTDVTNTKAQIVLSNSGTAPVKITKASVTRGTAAHFTLPDLNQFNGLDIPAGESKTYDISYQPGAAAYDSLDITFENDANAGTIFQAIGVGVVPHIIIDDVTFATLSLLGGNPKDNKKWRITNLSKATTPAWEFYDSVKVTDLTVSGQNNDEIGEGGQSTIGTQRMSYDKTTVGLPLSLKAGEVSTSFDAWYQPVDLGNNSATLTTISDAEVEQVSKWNGSATGGVLEYTVSIPNVSTCAGSSVNIPVTITNTSKVALDMTDIIFKWQGTVSGDLSLPNKPSFPIPPGGTQTVNIVYTPSGLTPTTRITLISEAQPGPVVVNASFEITGEFYPSTLNVAKNVKAAISKDGSTNFFRVPVTLGPDVNSGSVMALKATITFDPKAMFIRRTAPGSSQALITLNTADGAAKGWTVTSSTVTAVSDRLETVAIEMSGATPLSNGANKDLFYLDFQTLLAPMDVNLSQILIDLKDVKAYKEQSATTENLCVRITPTPGFVVGTVVCAYDVTQVSTSAVAFGMRTASPNPVSDAGTRIEFGVGFEAPTRIDVINTNGEVVATLVNEVLKSNIYTLNFVPVNLPSGSYIVRMISAGNTFSQQVQIVK